MTQLLNRPSVDATTMKMKKSPDIIPIDALHKMLGIDETFHAEFGILSPHLRKITKNWKMEIPIKIAEDDTAQDTMTVRDLNEIFEGTQGFLDNLYAGRFYDEFEAALDGIAVILKTHGINPAWAMFAFASSFDLAHQQLYFETRNSNRRVYPAALRCLNKIMVLSLHLLSRRDHELNDITPPRRAAGRES